VSERRGRKRKDGGEGEEIERGNGVRGRERGCY